MERKLKPLAAPERPRYPSARRGLLRGALVAASMTATSLGGCGPGLDSQAIDTAIEADGLDECLDGEDCTDDDGR